MAPDFAVYYLTRPSGIAFQLALILIPLLLLRVIAPTAFARVGFRRLGFGHAAVAILTFLLALIEASTLGSSKAPLGHVPTSEASSWILGTGLYMFVLMYILALAYASFVVAPATVWLFKRNSQSLLVLAKVGCAVAVLIASIAVVFPRNSWAKAHPVGEFLAALSSVGLGAVLVPIAFGLGAQIPLRRPVARNAA